MGFRERFGCFLLAVGLVTLVLFALPIAQAFRRNPGSVPTEWIGIAALSMLFLWAGWRLYSSARRSVESRKSASLGARIAARWRSKEPDDSADRP